jgi:hypothetical protein
MPSCHGNSLSVLGESSPRHSRAVHGAWAQLMLVLTNWTISPAPSGFKQRSAEGYTVRILAGTTRVFRRDSPGKAAQWLARSIRESWGVLWLVIRLLSVRADVSSSVSKAWERLYCIPLHTCQHAGALPTTTRTSPTPRRRTVTSKDSSYMLAMVTQYLRVIRQPLQPNGRKVRTRATSPFPVPSNSLALLQYAV